MSKALGVSKTQRRDGQVIPHLSDPDQKKQISKCAVQKSKHFPERYKYSDEINNEHRALKGNLRENYMKMVVFWS